MRFQAVIQASIFALVSVSACKSSTDDGGQRVVIVDTGNAGGGGGGGDGGMDGPMVTYSGQTVDAEGMPLGNAELVLITTDGMFELNTTSDDMGFWQFDVPMPEPNMDGEFGVLWIAAGGITGQLGSAIGVRANMGAEGIQLPFTMADEFVYFTVDEIMQGRDDSTKGHIRVAVTGATGGEVLVVQLPDMGMLEFPPFATVTSSATIVPGYEFPNDGTLPENPEWMIVNAPEGSMELVVTKEGGDPPCDVPITEIRVFPGTISNVGADCSN